MMMSLICNGKSQEVIIMESKRNIDSELGLFIYTIIGKSGMTKEDIAEKLNVSPRTVYFYCTGQRKPQQKVLLSLIKLTRTNCEDIPF